MQPHHSHQGVDDMLLFTQEETSESTVLSLEGELIMEYERVFFEKVHEVAAMSRVPLVLDLKNVQFVDSTGIGALISLIAYFKDQGQQIRIIRMNPVLEPVIQNFLNQ